MKLRGPLVIAALVFAAFFAVNAGTSSATVLCKMKIPECPGNALPVPEIVPSNLKSGTEAVFTQTLGARCKVSNLELKQPKTSDFGQNPCWPKSLGGNSAAAADHARP